MDVCTIGVTPKSLREFCSEGMGLGVENAGVKEVGTRKWNKIAF